MSKLWVKYNVMPAFPLMNRATWQALLQDQLALLKYLGPHHKVLVMAADAIHRSDLIDRDCLSDLLEEADGVLAYAVEALLDEPCGE